MLRQLINLIVRQVESFRIEGVKGRGKPKKFLFNVIRNDLRNLNITSDSLA